MRRADRDAFFARAADLDLEAYLLLDYRIECSGERRYSTTRTTSRDDANTQLWSLADAAARTSNL